MFDLRKFWLATAAYGLTIGLVIAAVCVAFATFIGMPTKGYQQTVTQPADQLEGANGVRAEIRREAAAPAAPPAIPLAHRTPAANIVAEMPQLVVPKPLIVPEPGSTRRGLARNATRAGGQ